MASSVKFVRCTAPSASVEEARGRVFEFFKTACRCIPTIMDVYNLDDVVTPSQLRSAVASQIRQNAHISDTKVIDMMLFKGMEELNNIVEHSKQRHHIIGQYVLNRNEHTQDLRTKEPGSEYLKNFFRSNYF